MENVQMLIWKMFIYYLLLLKIYSHLRIEPVVDIGHKMS